MCKQTYDLLCILQTDIAIAKQELDLAKENHKVSLKLKKILSDISTIKSILLVSD